MYTQFPLILLYSPKSVSLLNCVRIRGLNLSLHSTLTAPERRRYGEFSSRDNIKYQKGQPVAYHTVWNQILEKIESKRKAHDLSRFLENEKGKTFRNELLSCTRKQYSKIRFNTAPLHKFIYMKNRHDSGKRSIYSASFPNAVRVAELCPNWKRVVKVTLLGAGGSVGGPLSMMLKQSPLIDELSLYDISNISGLGLDISHMDTRCKVCTYIGEEELTEALKNARIVVMAAGVPFKDDMSFDEHFRLNAEMIASLTRACIQACPDALIAVLTSPLNSIVPVVSELFLEEHCVRVFGVMGVEILNANTALAETLGLDPENVNVPVIGGSSSGTAVPIFTQTRPKVEVSGNHELERLIRHVQNHCADKLQVNKRSSNRLSMAFAAARFTISLCKAIIGQNNVIECAYVRSKVVDGCAYLSSELELGPTGVVRNWGLPNMSAYEQCEFGKATDTLRFDIEKAMLFLNKEKEKTRGPRQCPLK